MFLTCRENPLAAVVRTKRTVFFGIAYATFIFRQLAATTDIIVAFAGFAFFVICAFFAIGLALPAFIIPAEIGLTLLIAIAQFPVGQFSLTSLVFIRRYACGT